MEKLILAKEGVFPVIKDHNGKHINDKPQTGFHFAGTIQGEGKLSGVPSLFVRLSSCNLRCIWQMKDGSFCQCDTTYASFHPNQVMELTVQQLFDWIKHNLGHLKHVVITGGEPLLQKKALATLCQRLKEELQVHITLETNGTLFDPEVAQWVDLFSLSPKLSNSSPTPEKLSAYDLKEAGPLIYHNEKRINLKALQAYIDLTNTTDKDLQLKFVVGKQDDDKEIKSDFLQHLNNWNNNDILLMPLGATHEQIAQSSPLALEMAITNAWRYSPRIHIDLFGSKSGV